MEDVPQVVREFLSISPNNRDLCERAIKFIDRTEQRKVVKIIKTSKPVVSEGLKKIQKERRGRQRTAQQKRVFKQNAVEYVANSDY